MQSKTLIFGHRGYPKQFPENSLAGFRYALAHGIEGLCQLVLVNDSSERFGSICRLDRCFFF